MKQIYLKPRGGARTPLRSDTLFGLITWGVRQVYGRASVERFLAPMTRDPPEAPLLLTSAFPYVDTPEGRLHYFPRPLSQAAAENSRWMEDRELLAFVSGREAGSGATFESRRLVAEGWVNGAPSTSRAAGGLFFLAAGPAEHLYLEAALGFLERFGFGGDGSTGQGAYDVEMKDAEFLRLAQPGELSLLLSLYLPTAGERQAIVAAARQDAPVFYALERRRGAAGGRLCQTDRPFKQPVVMLREGSVLPYAGAPSAGCSPVVGTLRDGDLEFSVVQHGFGFFVPITGALT